jgi:hypothetical protein
MFLISYLACLACHWTNLFVDYSIWYVSKELLISHVACLAYHWTNLFLDYSIWYYVSEERSPHHDPNAMLACNIKSSLILAPHNFVNVQKRWQRRANIWLAVNIKAQYRIIRNSSPKQQEIVGAYLRRSWHRKLRQKRVLHRTYVVVFIREEASSTGNNTFVDVCEQTKNDSNASDILIVLVRCVPFL